jgi:UDPglucose 6-dehydrogenase
MRMTIIGSGYVGLVSGVCVTDFEDEITCVDEDDQKTAALRRPGLPSLVRLSARISKARISHTAELAEADRSVRAPACFELSI